MQEFFYTILAIWLIWKIFGMFSNSRKGSASNTYTQTNNNNYYPPRQGDVRVEEKPKQKPSKAAGDDDYVDFEEIK
jgi:hypothetical protein